MNTELAKLQVVPSASLLEVMACIDRNAKGIALVMTEDGKLMGTVTDGDIRRAVLSGGTLTSSVAPYMQKRFTAVSSAEGRAEVLDLMQSRQLRHVPVVDEAGRLVGLHLLQELLGKVSRPNWAVVMAGGKGVRLRPITEHVPKPMLLVAGRPILERLVLHLVGFGFVRIFLSVNYLSQVIENHFGDGSRYGCRIEYLREDEPLGTAGSLALLPEPPQHSILVVNGDLVTQANLDRFLGFHAAGEFAASVAVRRYVHQVPFGCLDTKDGRVLAVEEKPSLERLINAGIYLLAPQTVARVPKTSYLMTDLLSECLATDKPVGAFEIDEEWIDIGQHEQLKKAQNGDI